MSSEQSPELVPELLKSIGELSERVSAMQLDLVTLRGGSVTQPPSEWSAATPDSLAIPTSGHYEDPDKMLEAVKSHVHPLKPRTKSSNPLGFAAYWVELRAALISIGYEEFVTKFEAGEYSQYGSYGQDTFLRRVIKETISSQIDLWSVEQFVSQYSTMTTFSLLNDLRRIVTGRPAGAAYYKSLFALPQLDSAYESITSYFHKVDIAYWSYKWSGADLPESEVAGILFYNLHSAIFSEFKETVRGSNTIPKSYLEVFPSVDEFKKSLAEYIVGVKNSDEELVPDDNAFEEVMG